MFARKITALELNGYWVSDVCPIFREKIIIETNWNEIKEKKDVARQIARTIIQQAMLHFRAQVVKPSQKV